MRERPTAWCALVLGAALVLAETMPAGPARAQISPGPLSRAHEKLEGNLNCTKCHGLGKDEIDPQCLACHTEIGWSIDEGVGLHARQRDTPCAKCHPEHAGRDFALIDWGKGGRQGFDHAQTGFVLEGKHATLDCETCHTEKFRISPVAHRIQSTRETSYLGLENRCASCHTDVHEKRLGEGCGECHDASGWRNTPRFKHLSTGYPLEGRHMTLECVACHKSAANAPAATSKGGRPRYTTLPHAECSDCHRDPHDGGLGPRCAECHVEDGFQLARTQGFDHSRSRFPLRGRHRSVACEACHDPVKAWGKHPAFDRCAACHRDPHAGQTAASLQGKSPGCDACHDETGFRPSTFTTTQHASTRYPLEGKHRDVPCRRCHGLEGGGPGPDADPAAAGSAKVWLRPRFDTCTTCHGSAHGDQLAARADGGRCESCHTAAGFVPSTFTAAEHASLQLPLTGRHAEIPCARCHGPDRSGLPAPSVTGSLGSARVALTLTDAACTACHFDPHEGRYATVGDSGTTGCPACHDTQRFRPAVMTFQTHARLGFALEGAHQAVPCIACHADLRQRPAASSLPLGTPKPAPFPLDPAPTTCAGCHESPHGTQFDSRADGGRCESCHGTAAFVPADRFDHDRDTRFRLEGAHARVACDRCHVAQKDAQGRSFLVYRPLDGRCESCHATDGRLQLPSANSKPRDP